MTWPGPGTGPPEPLVTGPSGIDIIFILVHHDVMTDTDLDLQAGSDTSQQTIALSVRVPRPLADRLKDRADEQQRSVNWLIKDLILKFLQEDEEKVTWPENSGGRSLFGVAMRWYMPDFCDLTEERIDLAIARAAQALIGQGAEGVVVDGPWAEMPMSMREPNYGEGVAAVNRYPS